MFFNHHSGVVEHIAEEIGFCELSSTLCDSTDKNTGVGCHFLLQGIFLTQGSNPHLWSPALAGEFFTTGPPVKPAGFQSNCK